MFLYQASIEECKDRLDLSHIELVPFATNCIVVDKLCIYVPIQRTARTLSQHMESGCPGSIYFTKEQKDELEQFTNTNFMKKIDVPNVRNVLML